MKKNRQQQYLTRGETEYNVRYSTNIYQRGSDRGLTIKKIQYQIIDCRDLRVLTHFGSINKLS